MIEAIVLYDKVLEFVDIIYLIGILS